MALWPLALLMLHRPEMPLPVPSHVHLEGTSQWLNEDWTPLSLQWLSAVALCLAVFTRRWTVLPVVLTALEAMKR